MSRAGVCQRSQQPVTRPIFCTEQLTANVRKGQTLSSHRDDTHGNATFQNNDPWKTWKISDGTSGNDTENSSQHRPPRRPHRDLRIAPSAHAGTATTVALPRPPHQSREIIKLITKISQITSADTDTQPSLPVGDDIHLCSALASVLKSPLCIPTREMSSTTAGSSACARHASNAHTIHCASASSNNLAVLRFNH